MSTDLLERTGTEVADSWYDEPRAFLGKPCERITKECSRPATHKVWWGTCINHGVREQKLCTPCYEYLTAPDDRPVMCFRVGECDEEVHALYVERI